MPRKIGLPESYIELNNNHLYHFKLKDTQGKKLRKMRAYLGIFVPLMIIIGVVLESSYLSNHQIGNQSLQTIIKPIIYIATIILILVLSIVSYQLLKMKIFSIKDNIELDYYLCFQEHKEDTRTINCINKGDEIVEAGLFWPNPELLENEDYTLFEQLKYTGYNPTDLRDAERDDDFSPYNYNRLIFISKTGKLYPLTSITRDNLTSSDISLGGFEKIRNHFDLKLNRYDYVFELGQIICLPYQMFNTSGILVRKKGLKYPHLYTYYKDWLQINIHDRHYDQEKAISYNDDQLDKYGK